MNRSRNMLAASALALALIGAFVLARPASASVPDASVAINPQAHEGQRDTIIGSVFARCAPGFEFAGLNIEITQGSSFTSISGRSAPCDGRWHKQSFSTPEEAWTPGPAEVSARLSVTHVDTGDPGHQGTQSRQIYVRPGVKAVLPATAQLLADRSVRLVTKARCDRPWVLQSYGVDLTQGEFPDLAAGSDYTQTRPACDGALHRVTFTISSVQDVAFHRGWVRVNASMTTLDPVNFDPAPSGGATRWVRIR